MSAKRTRRKLGRKRNRATPARGRRARSRPKAVSGQTRAAPAPPPVTAPARKKKKPKTPPPPQSAIWPAPPALSQPQARAALRAAMTRAGAALIAAGGALEAPPPPAPMCDPLLAHLAESAEVYACCGGIDVSGSTRAETFARLERVGGAAVLSVYYRMGRDELIEGLAQAAQAACARIGWETRGTFAKEKPTIFHAAEFGSGVWGARMTLHPPAASYAGRLSARERQRGTILVR